MLEETDDKSKDLAVGISNDLDVIALVTTMKDLYNVSTKIKKKGRLVILLFRKNLIILKQRKDCSSK